VVNEMRMDDSDRGKPKYALENKKELDPVSVHSP
jgi:hypothetical protein